jgi:hypothetical protein
MDGLMLLNEAHAAGLDVVIDGNKLVVRGPRRAECVARKLLAHKREVMAAVAGVGPSTAAPITRVDSTDAANWRELYVERAAFRQYEAGYRRDAAEQLAFGEVIELWCRHNPQHYAAGICAGCGQPLGGDVLNLPDGSQVHWEQHYEFACLIAAGLRRKERAVAALAALGLFPPPGWEA